MAEIDMKELIKENFADDPLYMEINTVDIHLRKYLYPDFLNELSPARQYSTIEASAMLKEKDPTVRYYMKNLSKYVQPIRNNRNYRLMYKSIYRLYLIFVYTRENDRNTNDIKALLPMYEVYSIVEDSSNVVNDTKEVSKKRLNINDEFLLNAFLNNMQFQAKESQVTYDLHNAYIDHIQLNLKIESINKQYNKKERELYDAERELTKLNNELIDLKVSLRQEYQWKNIESILKKTKEKQSLLEKIKHIFNKSEEEETEVFTVNDDDPKLVSQRELIKKKQEEIVDLQEELNQFMDEIEEREEDYKLLTKEIYQLVGKLPNFSEQGEIAARLTEEKLDEGE